MHKETPVRVDRWQWRQRSLRLRFTGWPKRGFAEASGVLSQGFVMQLFQDGKLPLQGLTGLTCAPLSRGRRHLINGGRTAATGLRQWVCAAVTIALSTLMSESVRHWVIIALTNVCIIGGVIAAPIVSVLGWVGMALPANAPLHVAAPILFTAALIWLCLALVGAHAASGSAHAE